MLFSTGSGLEDTVGFLYRTHRAAVSSWTHGRPVAADMLLNLRITYEDQTQFDYSLDFDSNVIWKSPEDTERQRDYRWCMDSVM